MEPTLLTVVLQWFGIATASVTLMVAIYGAGSIPYIKNWIGKIIDVVLYPFTTSSRKLKSIAEEHIKINDKIDFIVDQLKPNSGTSLRDAVNRLEKNQLIHEAKMSHYLDSQNAVMFETSAEGLYTWVSKGYEDLTGRHSGELRNWGWTLSIAAQDVALVRSEWYMAIEQKRIFEKVYNVKDVDGKLIECYCRAVPTIVNNNVIAWIGSLKPTGM
jgi:PAS domain-containing protein